ncbi:MAG: hypothetical protein Q8S57_01740 [Methanoregula sp.]|nr:hypothetical protein [Methanoregula sp.]
MTPLGEKKGLGIFIGLLIMVIVVSLAAYSITGDMGIEERFTHALGLQSEGDEEGSGGFFGLALEGSPLLYAFVLGVLVVACYGAYRHFSV